MTLLKGYKFISSRKQEKCTKANCMTTEAHFLEKMKKLDFKQCAERQYQQTLVAKNLCWVNRFFTCWLKILNYVLESLQLLSKYNWLLTNHADIALEVSHTKLTKMLLAFPFKLLIKVFNQIVSLKKGTLAIVVLFLFWKSDLSFSHVF